MLIYFYLLTFDLPTSTFNGLLGSLAGSRSSACNVLTISLLAGREAGHSSPWRSSPCSPAGPPPSAVSLSASGSLLVTEPFLSLWRTLQRGHRGWGSWQRRSRGWPSWQSRTIAKSCPGSRGPSRACQSSPREWCTGRQSAWPARCCRSLWCRTEAPPSSSHRRCRWDTRRSPRKVLAPPASPLHTTLY